MAEEASIVITAVDKTEAALKGIQNNVGALEGQFNRLSGVVTGFAALAGGTAFAGLISGAIDSAAGLHDLSMQSGATVEALSALKGVAKINNVEIEALGGALGKLSKNMLDAANGSGDAAKVFKALDISVLDTSGKLKTSDVVMGEFAKSLQTVTSHTERAAAAQLVFGKSGAQLMPMLNDLAELGQLQAKITAEQAAAADEFGDNMTKLSTVHKAWVTTVAMEVVPVANAFSQALLETATSAGGLKSTAQELARDGSIKEWATSAAKAVGFVVDAFDGVGRVASVAGKTIGAAAAQAAAVANGEFRQAMAIGKEWTADVDAILAKPLFSDALNRQLANLGSSSEEAARGGKSLAGVLGEVGDKADKAAKAVYNLHLEQMKLLHKQADDELKDITEARAKAAKAEEEYGKALYAGTKSLEDQATALEREVANYGKSESAIQATTVARLEEARAIAAANGASEDHLMYLDREIEARKRIASASSQKEFLDANKRAAEESAREWTKFSDQIYQSLTDSIYRGVESGKADIDDLAEYTVNTFKAMAIKFGVQYVVSGTGQLLGLAGNAAINGVMGTSSNNNGAGTNYLGVANNAQSAYSLYGMAANTYQYGIADTFQGLYYGAQNFFSPAPAASQFTVPTASQSALAGETATGAGTGSGTGSLSASTVGWVAAIVMGMYMSSEAWKAGVRWENYAQDGDAKKYDAEVGIRAAHDNPARAIFGDDFVDSEFYAVAGGGSLSAQIHMALQKAMWGEWESTGISSLRGSFSEAAGGFSGGEQGMEYRNDGGWFRGAKNDVKWQGISDGFDSMLDGMYKTVRNSMVMIGETFDDNTLADKLTGWSLDIQHNNTTNMQASLSVMADQLTESLGAVLFPSVGLLKGSAETYSQALTRVLAETQAASRMFDMMGTSINNAFGQGNADRVLALSDALVQVFGSVDNLNASFAGYYANYSTQEEQQAQAWADMGRQFEVIGETMPTTRDGFRDLVESLDLSTSSGQATFRALMDVQGAFAALTPTLDDAAAAAMGQVTGATDAALATLERAVAAERTAAQVAADAAQEQVDALRSVFDLLDSSIRDLYGSTASAAREGMAFIDNALATAQTSGYMPDSTDLGNALSAVRADLDSKVYASSVDQQRDRLVLAGKLSQLQTIGGGQLSMAKQQLSAAQGQVASLDRLLASSREQVETMRGVDNSVLSVVDAVDNLNTTLVNETQAQTASLIGAILSGLSAGTINSTTAGTQLTTQGVPVDTATTVNTLTGSQDVFVSSKGAVQVDDTLNAVGGWSGSVDAAKTIVTDAYGALSAADFRTAVIGVGLSAAAIDNLYGFTPGTANQWAEQNGLPRFASGGYYPGGLALVGEEGPEIINFDRPGQVYTAPQTAALMGGNNGRLERLVEALTAEVVRLQGLVNNGNREQRRTADAVNGRPDAPVPVEIA